MSDFHYGAKVRARKEHICECCFGKIPVGDKYIREAGVYDGDFYHYRVHEGCHDLASRVYNEENEPFSLTDTLWIAADLGWISQIQRGYGREKCTISQ